MRARRRAYRNLRLECIVYRAENAHGTSHRSLKGGILPRSVDHLSTARPHSAGSYAKLTAPGDAESKWPKSLKSPDWDGSGCPCNTGSARTATCAPTERAPVAKVPTRRDGRL